MATAIAIVGCASTDDGSADSDGAGAALSGSSASSANLPGDDLATSRERLLTTYLSYLSKHPTRQSNGLLGSELGSTCDLWTKLTPSSQLVFLTLTARLQGSMIASKVAADGGSMLRHVTQVYRIAGGDGATATSPGSCGGGEANRMIMSIDANFHALLVDVNKTQGKDQSGVLIHDVSTQASSFWRNSHDLGGAHAPFDLSDETDHGAPRGQLQFFGDPSSSRANAALGRTDLADLVDPLALEMDQDYDCPHNSNPACSYTSFQALCFPTASTPATKIYTDSYGSFSGDWQPTSCAK